MVLCWTKASSALACSAAGREATRLWAALAAIASAVSGFAVGAVVGCAWAAVLVVTAATSRPAATTTVERLRNIGSSPPSRGCRGPVLGPRSQRWKVSTADQDHGSGKREQPTKVVNFA